MRENIREPDAITVKQKLNEIGKAVGNTRGGNHYEICMNVWYKTQTYCDYITICDRKGQGPPQTYVAAPTSLPMETLQPGRVHFFPFIKTTFCPSSREKTQTINIHPSRWYNINCKNKCFRHISITLLRENVHITVFRIWTWRKCDYNIQLLCA